MKTFLDMINLKNIAAQLCLSVHISAITDRKCVSPYLGHDTCASRVSSSSVVPFYSGRGQQNRIYESAVVCQWKCQERWGWASAKRYYV